MRLRLDNLYYTTDNPNKILELQELGAEIVDGEVILDEDKTNIIKICTNISEKKVLNHDLNIHEVEVVTSESNANGNSKIKILIRI